MNNVSIVFLGGRQAVVILLILTMLSACTGGNKMAMPVLPSELEGQIERGMTITDVLSVLARNNIEHWEPYESTPYGANPRPKGSGMEILARVSNKNAGDCSTGSELVFQFNIGGRLEETIVEEFGICQ